MISIAERSVPNRRCIRHRLKQVAIGFAAIAESEAEHLEIRQAAAGAFFRDLARNATLDEVAKS